MHWIKVADSYVQSPIFYGKEWFLDCRTDEPLLVVHIYRDPSEMGLRKRMRRILREAGIAGTLVHEESHRDVSAFPPNFNGLKSSAAIRVELAELPLQLAEGVGIHTPNDVRGARPEGDVLNEQG